MYERDGASVTPTGMPRRYGQSRQEARARIRRAILPDAPADNGPDPYRQLDPNRNVAQGVANPATGTVPPPPQSPVPPTPPQGPVGNGVDARAALGGYAGVGNMLGFNTALDYPDQKAANSVKNTFGRIASRYDTNAPGFLQALLGDADFQRYFPDARLGPEEGRGGMIDFGGVLSDFESGVPVGLVDVLNAYDGQTSKGWQWLDQNGAPQQSMMPANDIYTQTAQAIQTPQVPQFDNNSVLMMLLQALQGQGRGPGQGPNFF